MKKQSNHSENSTVQIFKIDGVGVNLDRFHPVHSTEEKNLLRKKYGYSNDDFIITVVAELNKNKNQIMLIKAVPLLKIVIPHLKILLIGMESLPYVRNFVKENNLEKYVCFLGYRHDIENFTMISDIAFSASMREGLPVNIIEAMACGLPVVCSNNRGHRSLIKDKETGFIFNLNCEKEMVDAILLLYKNPSLRTEMGNRNIAEAKKYSIDIAINNMAEIYKNVMY